MIHSLGRRATARFAAALLLPLICSVNMAVADNTLGKFTLTCLDIRDVNRGAGLAVVLQTPSGRTYLYDTGVGYPDKGGWQGDYNSGRDLIVPFLKDRGIRELDGVAISHAHYDHFGGLLWLVDEFPVKKLFDSGYEFPGTSSDDYASELGQYSKLRAQFKARADAYQEAHTGDKLAFDDRLEVEVISPPKEFFSEPHPERRPKNDPPAHYLVNANSLGLRIRHGKVVFLLPGDIQSEDQLQSLLPATPAEKLRCHVLIAPGHGIHAVPQFASATRPEVTVASIHARYGKSSPAVRVYGDVGSKVYVTGLHGNVRFISDGTTYTVQADRPASK